MPDLTGTGNAQLDNVLLTATTTTDKAKRQAVFDQITKILFDQAYFVFVTHPRQQTWVAKEGQGRDTAGSERRRLHNPVPASLSEKGAGPCQR